MAYVHPFPTYLVVTHWVSTVLYAQRACMDQMPDVVLTHLLLPQDDLFEWHFTIRGPKDTEFEGGLYHGRILLPAEFPYRPPDIIFLTVRN